MKKFVIPFLAVLVLSCTGCRCLFHTVSNEEVLVEGLKSDAYWTAIHAAEYLIDLKVRHDKVAEFIDEKTPVSSNETYDRIGLWRVTALAFKGTERGNQAIKNIRQVAFYPEKIEDRVHAIETLFKLGVKLNAEEIAWMKNYCANFEAPENGRVYAAGLLMHSDMKSGVDFMKKFYQKNMERGVMIYCFKFFNDLPEDALLIAKDIQLNPTAPDNMRMLAISVLLNNKAMDFTAAAKAAAELDTDGTEFVRISVAHNSNAILRAVEKLSCFRNKEHRILKAWAKAHICKDFSQGPF